MKSMTAAPLSLILAVSMLLQYAAPVTAAPKMQNWPVYGGDPGGLKYSPLTQINRSNVQELQMAWTWKTGERPGTVLRRPILGLGYHERLWNVLMAARFYLLPVFYPLRLISVDVRPGVFEATPLMVDDTLYLSTSYTRAVALDANSGAELWSFDPKAYVSGPARFRHRGVAMWTNGQERRIFLNSRWRLFALDAATGRPIASFGNGGAVDLTENLSWETNRLHYRQSSPPVIYNDLVIVGSAIPDKFAYKRDPPGDVQAFDVHSGKLVWRFNTVPRAGEFGTDTWQDDSWAYTGHTNVWAPFTVDVERGLVYLPVSTPSSDHYGGHRKGDNLFGESIVCLDANTGKRVWHFQTVHHGLWDHDLPSPPNLVTIRVAGKTIDAVVVLAKTGFAYVFDRVTGKPVWPIEERPVPQSDVPGEQTSLTQPFPTKPPPFSKQGFTEDDVIDFTPQLRAMALKAIKNYRLGPMFTPPSVEGTLMMPGYFGGANWGGGAFDPETGVLHVSAKNWPILVKLVKPKPGASEFAYVPIDTNPNIEGLPIHKPPYRTLTAIDLNTGEHAWQVPIGDAPWIKTHSLLKGVDVPQLGTTPYVTSGPLVTGGGLVFISGGSSKLYGIDTTNGKVLWEGDLGGRLGTGNPMSYQTRLGRQFVVVATSKRDGADATLMAFALSGSGP